MSKWKRGRGKFGIGDPLQDTRKVKKLRSEEQPIENPLDQITKSRYDPSYLYIYLLFNI